MDMVMIVESVTTWQSRKSVISFLYGAG